jgi:hypothetical protein
MNVIFQDLLDAMRLLVFDNRGRFLPGIKYKLGNLSLGSFLNPPVTSSLLGLDIIIQV